VETGAGRTTARALKCDINTSRQIPIRIFNSRTPSSRLVFQSARNDVLFPTFGPGSTPAGFIRFLSGSPIELCVRYRVSDQTCNEFRCIKDTPGGFPKQ